LSSITPSPTGPATAARRGTQSAAHFTKLEDLPANAALEARFGAIEAASHPAVTVSSPANWLTLVGQALTFALVSASGVVAGVVDLAAQTFAGVKTFTSAIIASAGVQLASLWNTNGTGASDVGVKVGVSTADGSVNAAAKLFSVRTGLNGGTEVEYLNLTKTLLDFPMGGASSWKLNFESGHLSVRTGSANIVSFLTSGTLRSGYGFDVNPSFGAFLSFQVAASGLMNQRGIDSAASPGALTADRPIGRNAIAAGASSVVITNNLVTATTHIVFSQHARDATCKELIVVAGAGFFTVSGSANATAALPFSWRVASLLTS